jgi:hypothetical protein
MKKIILIILLFITASCSTNTIIIKKKKTNPKITLYERVYTMVVFYSIYTNPN